MTEKGDKNRNKERLALAGKSKRPSCAKTGRERFFGKRRTPLAKSAKYIHPVFAAIDLGTTNCRLLIATPTPTGFGVKETFSRITRLGEGLISDGVLSERAVKRTIYALKLCVKKLKKYKTVKTRFVATEACRRAKNGAEFVERVKKETGLDMEIISFEEECRLGVAGCVPLINRNIRYAVVFDIGGGSTEVSFARIDKNNQVKIEGLLSFPLGVVTVSEAFTGKELSSAAYRAVVKKVLSYLQPFENKYGVMRKIKQGEVQMIAMSGTVTTIGAFHLELPSYNRAVVDGMALSYQDLTKAKRKLEKMTYAEKEAHPCIGTQRADLSLPGCAILQGICEMWPIGEITIADRGLREGIVLDLIRRENSQSGKK